MLAFSDGYPGVRISTIHSAKGLEFPAAAVIFADQLPRVGLEDVTEAEQRHLPYVGMTRACDHLLVTGSPRRSDCFFKHLCRTSFGVPSDSEWLDAAQTDTGSFEPTDEV